MPDNNTARKGKEYQDCTLCKVIGAGVLSGVGMYSLFLARGMRNVPRTGVRRTVFGIMGIGEFLRDD